VDSANWSGYAVTGPTSSVTYAAGSWIVPASTCPVGASHHRATPEYAAFWVGIDGWSSNTVEQIGTDSDCYDGTPSYYAWYEMYPQASYNASCTAQEEHKGTCSQVGNMTSLKPGDVISASVTYNASDNNFTLAISDLSSGASFSITLTPKGTPQRSSAEWIAEAPSSSSAVLPLADFGAVNFGDYSTQVPLTCYATVAGVAGPISIGSFANDSAYGISLWSSTMVTNSGAAMATPSALSADGSSFSVTWNSVGP
jgi:Peptidase A4 family